MSTKHEERVTYAFKTFPAHELQNAEDGGATPFVISGDALAVMRKTKNDNTEYYLMASRVGERA